MDGQDVALASILPIHVNKRVRGFMFLEGEFESCKTGEGGFIAVVVEGIFRIGEFLSCLLSEFRAGGVQPLIRRSFFEVLQSGSGSIAGGSGEIVARSPHQSFLL